MKGWIARNRLSHRLARSRKLQMNRLIGQGQNELEAVFRFRELKPGAKTGTGVFGSRLDIPVLRITCL